MEGNTSISHRCCFDLQYSQYIAGHFVGDIENYSKWKSLDCFFLISVQLPEEIFKIHTNVLTYLSMKIPS